MTLPDCMMPDGADPCAGYRALATRVRELEVERDALRAEHAEAERDALRAEVERLRGALDRAARTLRGETGCEDQGQAYDTAQCIIDAALAQGEKT